MTEFGATLLSFIKLSAFENQTRYATVADVADSTVTRAVGGGSFSTDLLGKLVAPFPEEKQLELVRAYMRDRLKEGRLSDKLIARAMQAGPDPIAGLRPDVRLLLQRLGVEISADPAFQRTLEDLLELIDQDARLRRLHLVAEPKAPKGKQPYFARGQMPRGPSQQNAG